MNVVVGGSLMKIVSIFGKRDCFINRKVWDVSGNVFNKS